MLNNTIKIRLWWGWLRFRSWVLRPWIRRYNRKHPYEDQGPDIKRLRGRAVDGKTLFFKFAPESIEEFHVWDRARLPNAETEYFGRKNPNGD